MVDCPAFQVHMTQQSDTSKRILCEEFVAATNRVVRHSCVTVNRNTRSVDFIMQAPC